MPVLYANSFLDFAPLLHICSVLWLCDICCYVNKNNKKKCFWPDSIGHCCVIGDILSIIQSLFSLSICVAVCVCVSEWFLIYL